MTDKESKGLVFWAGIKNLRWNKMETRSHEEMYVVKNEKVYLKYNPTHEQDFDPKQHYGIIVGKYMELAYICGLSVDREEIDARLNDKEHPQRIRNKKRMSSSNPRLWLKDMVNGTEMKEAKSEKKTAVTKTRIKVSNTQNEAILRKFKAVKRNKEEVNDPEPGPSQHDKSDKRSMKEFDVEPGCSQSEKTNKRSKTDFDAEVSHSLTNEGNKCNEAEDFKLVSNDKDDRKIIPYVVTPKPNLGRPSAHSTPLARSTTLCSGNCDHAKENRELLKKVEISEAFTSRTLASMAATLSVPTSCGYDISEGMIHLGDMRFLDGNIASTEVEYKTFDLRKRVKLLLPLCFGKDVHKFALQPDTVKIISTNDEYHITPTNVVVMTRVLNAMCQRDVGSSAKEAITEGKVRTLISKCMHLIREAHKVNTLSPEERAEIEKKKKEKAKASREAAKARAAEEKKKTKNSKKNASDSDD